MSDIQVGEALTGPRVRDDKTYREFAILYHDLKDKGLIPIEIAETVKAILGVGHTTYYDYLREARKRGFVLDTHAETVAARYVRDKLLREGIEKSQLTTDDIAVPEIIAPTANLSTDIEDKIRENIDHATDQDRGDGGEKSCSSCFHYCGCYDSEEDVVPEKPKKKGFFQRLFGR